MKIKKMTFSKRSLLLIGLALITLSACNEQPKKEAEPQEDEVVDVPEDLISLGEADSLYVNYSKRRAQSIVKMETADNSKPFKPVRFVSFDLKTIKEYIAYVEQEAKKGGTQADSLRVYLGNYGNVTGANERHNTVFFLPSAKAEGGYGGIYIGEDGKAKLIRNYFHKNGEEGKDDGKSKASFIPNLSTSLMRGNSLILNFGNCCPPKNSDF